MPNLGIDSEARLIKLQPGDRIVTAQLDAFQQTGNRVINSLLGSWNLTPEYELPEYSRSDAFRKILQLKDALRAIYTQSDLDIFTFQVDTGNGDERVGRLFRLNLVPQSGRVREVEVEGGEFRKIAVYETRIPDILLQEKTRVHTPNAHRSLVGRHRLAPIMHAKDFPKQIRLP